MSIKEAFLKMLAEAYYIRKVKNFQGEEAWKLYTRTASPVCYLGQADVNSMLEAEVIRPRLDKDKRPTGMWEAHRAGVRRKALHGRNRFKQVYRRWYREAFPKPKRDRPCGHAITKYQPATRDFICVFCRRLFTEAQFRELRGDEKYLAHLQRNDPAAAQAFINSNPIK